MVVVAAADAAATAKNLDSAHETTEGGSAELPSSATNRTAQSPGTDTPMLGLLGFGHMVIDINGGAIPALLPFLKSALSLTYASSGMIVMMTNITSSLIQPLFGYFADRTSRRWLLPLSVAVSSVGISLTGLVSSYAAVLALVVVTGLGIAAYHPEGYRTAAHVAGPRKATGISIFSLGGNVGIAVGPPLITLFVASFGLVGTVGMLVPGLAAASLLAVALPRMGGVHAHDPQVRKVQAGADNLRGMGILMGVVALRSWTQSGFSTYIPFYYTEVLHGSPAMVGTVLAIFLGFGAAGSLVAGPIADRIGMRRYAVGVFLLAAPLAAAYLLTRGWVSLVILGALGFVLVSTFTVTIVLAQAYMPRSPGMASGLIVGFATGAGGLGVTVLGRIADNYSLVTALWISAMMPLAAFVVSLFLPDPHERSR